MVVLQVALIGREKKAAAQPPPIPPLSMEKVERTIPTADQLNQDSTAAELAAAYNLTLPPGLTAQDLQDLTSAVAEFHNYQVKPGQCSSLLAQPVHAPPDAIWSILRRFDRPQTYKHFIKGCVVRDGFTLKVGDLRDVSVISGLPAATSTERLDVLDDARRVTGFSIVGGDHRLRNYRSVTSVHDVRRRLEEDDPGRISTVVLESYVVDIPDGNTEEDTRLFADTVVKLNLQKLASVAESTAAGD